VTRLGESQAMIGVKADLVGRIHKLREDTEKLSEDIDADKKVLIDEAGWADIYYAKESVEAAWRSLGLAVDTLQN
jgi:hypothetical protein